MGMTAATILRADVGQIGRWRGLRVSLRGRHGHPDLRLRRAAGSAGAISSTCLMRASLAIGAGLELIGQRARVLVGGCGGAGVVFHLAWSG